MGQLLRFCQDEEAPWWRGSLLALGLAISEMMRVLLFGASWGVSYRYSYTDNKMPSIVYTDIFKFRTGNRLRSGVMAMIFKKVMRLSSLGDRSIGGVLFMSAILDYGKLINKSIVGD